MKSTISTQDPAYCPEAVESAIEAIRDFDNTGIGLLEISPYSGLGAYHGRNRAVVARPAEHSRRLCRNVPGRRCFDSVLRGSGEPAEKKAPPTSRPVFGRRRLLRRLSSTAKWRSSLLPRIRTIPIFRKGYKNPDRCGLFPHYDQQHHLRYGDPRGYRFSYHARCRYVVGYHEPSGRCEEVRYDLRRCAEERRSCRRDVRHHPQGSDRHRSVRCRRWSITLRTIPKRLATTRCSTRLPYSRFS